MKAIRPLLVLCIAAAATLASQFVPGSVAAFSAQAVNAGSVYALTSVYAPTTLTAAAVGHDVALTWASGSNGNGYAVLGVGNGTSSNCTSATFAALGTTAGTSYTDTGRYTPQGTWFCYRTQTTYGSWSSVTANPTAAAQLGVVAATVQAQNGGTAGRLDTGDRIIVTFNQALATASGPSGTNTVCAVNGSPIVVGSTTTSGTCATGETTNLGKLTGGTTAANGRWNATWAWSAANTTLTVTLGTRTSGASVATTSGSWTFNPTTTAAKLLSSTGAFHTCDTNAGGGNCLPGMAGSF